jgi:hypothetical protein
MSLGLPAISPVDAFDSCLSNRSGAVLGRIYLVVTEEAAMNAARTAFTAHLFRTPVASPLSNVGAVFSAKEHIDAEATCETANLDPSASQETASKKALFGRTSACRASALAIRKEH